MDEILPVLMSGTQRRSFDGDALGQAAVRGVAALAGLSLEAAETVSADESVDERALAPRGALGEILEGERLDCLEEWLWLCRGRQMHPALIPKALDLSRGPRLVEAVGRRGLWLAAQNEDWRHHLGQGSADEVWETGVTRARAEWLRRQPSERAAELLRATWKDENAETRALLLEAGGRDQDLLEMALADRAKGVRLVAAQLLSQRFPQSALALRMSTLLKAGDPPAEDPGFALSFKGLGEKAGWLAQVAALAPLGPFVEPSGAWREALVQGLVLATLGQRRRDWALGLLQAGVESPELFQMLSAPERDALLLAGGPRWPWYVLHRPFSAALSHKVQRELWGLTRLRHEWATAQLLPSLGHCFPVVFRAALEQGWPEAGTQWRYWSHAVEKMLAVLTFRQRMHEEMRL